MHGLSTGLNSLTQRDAYPLPKIDECLDVLGGATVFSTLDLQSGYWQIAVEPKDHDKTVFITRYGLYEYTRMHLASAMHLERSR